MQETNQISNKTTQPNLNDLINNFQKLYNVRTWDSLSNQTILGHKRNTNYSAITTKQNKSTNKSIQ